ncbi:MAG TPA: PKD domain-containing protein, partial [Gemmataceae bacterium]|nr:PKD domain-containing protein [Gemmataceae bacterium]
LTVNNVAPGATITGAPATGHSPEGTAVTLGSSVTDPSSTDTAAGFTYAWNVTKNGVDCASWSAADFSFTPDDNATYVVTLTATDKDGGAGTTSTTITVDNVAPTATITGAPASAHSPESTAIRLGSSVTDPSSADTGTGFTYAWSVTKNGVAYASGTAADFSFTPDDNGTYVVSLTAADKDNGTSPTAQATILVDNVAPTAGVSGPTDGVRGQAPTFTVTATDPSAVDQAAGFTFAIKWGDGSTQTVTGPSGTAVSHVYTASGSYTVQVTATDKDQGTGTSTIVVKSAIPSSFGVSAIDKQVYKYALNLSGGASFGWSLVAPGQFSTVAATTYGPTLAPVVFGVGLDHKVYEAKFDANGELLSGWGLVAPGEFSSLVVGTYGSGQPILFGIGTAAQGQQVSVARFDAQGNLVSGWGSVAPGVFTSLAVGNFGSGNVDLFGISQNQAFFARFDSSGLFMDGWAPVAPGQFQSLTAANRTDGSLELFGAGLNGQAYAASFTNTGARAFGWFPVNSSQPVAFSQLTAAPLANGNLAAFGLGSDQHAYEATFDATTGVKLTGWSLLSTMMFADLSAAGQSGRTELNGLNAADHQVYVELFDAAGNVQSGFTLLAPGQLTDVVVAGRPGMN